MELPQHITTYSDHDSYQEARQRGLQHWQDTLSPADWGKVHCARYIDKEGGTRTLTFGRDYGGFTFQSHE